MIRYYPGASAFSTTIMASQTWNNYQKALASARYRLVPKVSEKYGKFHVAFVFKVETS